LSSLLDNAETLECGLTAFGSVQVLPAQLPALRRKPHEHVPMPTGLLKYADDQATVSLSAVFHAIHDFGLLGQDFTNWGVVAAPRFLGRETCIVFLERFCRQGALATSPLLAVYQSLHAVSGSISLALRIHGPNMGVGGGYGGLEQSLLAGLAMQHEHQLPGVWMVFSEWDPEPSADEGKNPDAICRAVAMAFTPVAANWNGLRLRFLPGEGQANLSEEEASLASLADFLAGFKTPTSADSTWSCPLNWNARLELTTRRQSLVAEPISAQRTNRAA
jgi:hypothetical protein